MKERSEECVVLCSLCSVRASLPYHYNRTKENTTHHSHSWISQSRVLRSFSLFFFSLLCCNESTNQKGKEKRGKEPKNWMKEAKRAKKNERRAFHLPFHFSLFFSFFSFGSFYLMVWVFVFVLCFNWKGKRGKWSARSLSFQLNKAQRDPRTTPWWS